VGLGVIAEKLKEWSEGTSAVHWSPSDLLMELAESGKSFGDWDRENT
jgi:hypothetical protein